MEYAGGQVGDVFGTRGILPVILEEIISPRKTRNTLKNKKFDLQLFRVFRVFGGKKNIQTSIPGWV
jgi:hypothetical protein